ncbi:MAG: alpha/beta hydrolase [Proteobacteria bacterium]|nr:alpha/beta hydrolase [Pseudomonadota bacterium]
MTSCHNLVGLRGMVKMRLHFLRWSPENPHSTPATLVFLHGMGGTGSIWRPIAAQLEGAFDCIAPDQRGHGTSRPVPVGEEERYHAEDYARDVSELLSELGIEKYFLIGHSMGVRTALALANREPEKVRGVLAIDIGVSSDWGGGIGIPLANFIRNLPESFPDRPSMRSHLEANCPDPAIAQYLAAVAQKTCIYPETWKFPFDHEALVKTIFQAHQAPLKQWLLHALENGVPVRFLRGANSKVWLKDDYEAMKTTLIHPLLTLEEWENCGHGLPFEQRGRLIALLSRTGP